MKIISRKMKIKREYLEEEMEIGGIGGGRERVVEEKFEVMNGGSGSDVKSDGFTS